MPPFETLTGAISAYKKDYPDAKIKILGVLPWLLWRKKNAELTDLQLQRIDFCIEKFKRTIAVTNTRSLELPETIQKELSLTLVHDEPGHRKKYRSSGLDWTIMKHSLENLIHHNLNMEYLFEEGSSESEFSFITPRLFNDKEFNKKYFLLNRYLFRINKKGEPEFDGIIKNCENTMAAILKTLLLSLFVGMRLAKYTQDFLNALERKYSPKHEGATYLDDILTIFFDKYYKDSDDDTRFIYDEGFKKFCVSDWGIEWQGTMLFARAKILNNRITSQSVNISQACRNLMESEKTSRAIDLQTGSTANIEIVDSNEIYVVQADGSSGMTLDLEDTEKKRDNPDKIEKKEEKLKKRNTEGKINVSEIRIQEALKIEEPIVSAKSEEIVIKYPGEDKIKEYEEKLGADLVVIECLLSELNEKNNRFHSNYKNLSFMASSIFQRAYQKKMEINEFENQIKNLHATASSLKNVLNKKIRIIRFNEDRIKKRIKENEDRNKNPEGEKGIIENISITEKKEPDVIESNSKEANTIPEIKKEFQDLINAVSSYAKIIDSIENEFKIPMEKHKEYLNKIRFFIKENLYNTSITKKTLNNEIRHVGSRVKELVKFYDQEKALEKESSILGASKKSPLPANGLNIIKRTPIMNNILLLGVAFFVVRLIADSIMQFKLIHSYIAYSPGEVIQPKMLSMISMFISVVGCILCIMHKKNPDKFWIHIGNVMRLTGIICGLLSASNQIVNKVWPSHPIMAGIRNELPGNLHATSDLPSINILLFSVAAVLLGIYGNVTYSPQKSKNITPDQPSWGKKITIT